MINAFYEAIMQLAEKPKFRGKLKGKIYEAGFKTMIDFAHHIGTDPARISRVLNGWEFPSTNLQTRIAEGLNIRLDDLGKIL